MGAEEMQANTLGFLSFSKTLNPRSKERQHNSLYITDTLLIKNDF